MSGPSASRVDQRAIGRPLRGFGPIGIAAFLVILLTGPPWFRAILVLIWAAWSRTPWKDLGFTRPRSWLGTVFVGIGVGVLLKFLCKIVIMPLLGADPINRSYHYLAGNAAALPAMLFMVIVSAGFGEETVFRGYLFERFGKLFGPSKAAIAVTVLLSAAMFALAHYPDQGISGVEQALVTGLVFGAIFALTLELWLVMIAHAAFDLTALAMIYCDAESKFAHLLFK